MIRARKASAEAVRDMKEAHDGQRVDLLHGELNLVPIDLAFLDTERRSRRDPVVDPVSAVASALNVTLTCAPHTLYVD